jgi:hypothetical protein
MSAVQTKPLHDVTKKGTIGGSNDFELPSADQSGQMTPGRPHLPDPTAAAQRLLRELLHHDEKIAFVVQTF